MEKNNEKTIFLLIFISLVVTCAWAGEGQATL